MLHHYGRVLPKIYASPIQPRSKIVEVDNKQTCFNFICSSLEPNFSEDKTLDGISASPLEPVSNKGNETKFKKGLFKFYFLNITHLFSFSRQTNTNEVV